MKKYLLFSFLCLALCSSLFAQSKIELKLKQYSMEPDFANQTHIITLENLSKETLEIQLSAKNIKCNDPRTKKYTNLDQVLSNQNSNKIPSNISLKPKEVFEFSITIKKPKNAILGSINCSEITANTIGQKPIAESLVIRSYVPDPNNAN